jgi:hypothetical protein
VELGQLMEGCLQGEIDKVHSLVERRMDKATFSFESHTIITFGRSTNKDSSSVQVP